MNVKNPQSDMVVGARQSTTTYLTLSMPSLVGSTVKQRCSSDRASAQAKKTKRDTKDPRLQ